MKRLVFIIILLLVECTIVFSETNYTGDFLTISVDSEKITCIEMNPFDSTQTTHEYNGKLSVQEPLAVFNCTDGTKLYVLQSEDIVIIYDEKNKPLFWGAGKGRYRNTERFLIGDKGYSCASELKETGKVYSAENLGNFYLDSPWCESENGYGEGVTIDLGTCGSALLFSNGYVSEKQYLYESNSRVKTIELTDSKDASFKKTITLPDTAIPQYIQVGEYPGRHIILKIIDVYPGTKWNDTCINFIIKIL